MPQFGTLGLPGGARSVQDDCRVFFVGSRRFEGIRLRSQALSQDPNASNRRGGNRIGSDKEEFRATAVLIEAVVRLRATRKDAGALESDQRLSVRII